ncbi:uncharacterized protein LOC133181255 [Saccostrea echinata]|uniref:uncharacterized protein LOC133181255 n=1 Tax=Saccostrea echinata TaxID=191078 RepID=UPI002A82A8E0|nr:uncharacterized protein LOC133181255 [Saccostrea echinata]
MDGGSTEKENKIKDDTSKTAGHFDEDHGEVPNGFSMRISSTERKIKPYEHETKNVENTYLKAKEEIEKSLVKQLGERKVASIHETISSSNNISSPVSTPLSFSENAALTNDIQNKVCHENNYSDKKSENWKREDPLADELRIIRCPESVESTSQQIKTFEKNKLSENSTRASMKVTKDNESIKLITTQNNATCNNQQEEGVRSGIFKFTGTSRTMKENNKSEKFDTFLNAQNFKTKSLDFKLPPSEEIRKLFPGREREKAKMACNRCNSWCFYWNVCRDCMMFLCDSCTAFYPHTPEHTTIRSKAFSEFGCLDHIQILKYFCLVCNSRRCDDCINLGRCHNHELKAIFGNPDQIESTDKVPAGVKIIKEESSTRCLKSSSIRGSTLSEHFCRYCQMSQKRYNICEDCMIYLCEACMERHHPNDHPICKQVPFHVFACSKHKQICRYFCHSCNNLRCDDCIVTNEQCSGHADRLVKILDYIKHKKDKFDEAIQQFSSRGSQSINMLSDRLEEIEETFSMNGILNKEILKQEFASLHQLITEREHRIYRNFEKEYASCMERIQQYKRRYGSIMKADSELISTSLQYLGKESLMEFYFSNEKIWERLDKHKKKLESLPSPDALLHSPILSPMSFYVEKSELDKSLQFKNIGPCSITCQRHVMYIEDVKAPIRVEDFISIPTPSLSKSYSICLEILTSVKKVISRSVHRSLDEYVANAGNLTALEPLHRYIFRFHVETSFRMSDKRITKSVSSPCHVLVITGKAPVQKEKQPKIYTTKCGDTVKKLISRVEGKLKLKDSKQHEEILGFCCLPRGENIKPIFLDTGSNFSLFGTQLQFSEFKTSQKSIGTRQAFVARKGKCFEQREGYIYTKHQCITAMPYYENKSLEELRAEDYLIKRLGWNGHITRRFRPPTDAETRFQSISAMTEYENYSPEELRLQDYITSGIIKFCKFWHVTDKGRLQMHIGQQVIGIPDKIFNRVSTTRMIINEMQATFGNSLQTLKSFSKRDSALSEQCRYCLMSLKHYNICEDCMIYLCDQCMVRYHPNDHTICKQVPFPVFACSKHNQICRFFCNFCNEMRCDDCIVTNEQCSGHADRLIKILEHIKQEKDKFIQAAELFSPRASLSIEMLSDRLEEVEETFSINAILNKEILRQEFASLRHLITEQEQEIYRDFEKEYESCMKSIQEYKRRYGSIMQANTKIKATSEHYLGKESLTDFYFNAEKIWKRLDKHKKNMKSLPSPDALLQSPILSPMSFYVEKSELDKSLQFNNLRPCSITCQQHVVYIEDVKAPIRLDDFISIPTPSLSKSYSICVEILTSVKKVISCSVHRSLNEYVANAGNLTALEPSHRYIFRFHVQTSFQMSDKRFTKSLSSPCNVLVITGKNFLDVGTNCSPFGTSLQSGEVLNGHITGRFRPPTDGKARFQSISAMKEYENYSPEELRLQDYITRGIVKFCKSYDLIMENRDKSGNETITDMEERLKLEHEEEIRKSESDEGIANSYDRNSGGDLVNSVKQNDLKSSMMRESIHRDEQIREVTELHISMEERLMKTGTVEEDSDSNKEKDRHEEEYNENEESLYEKSEITALNSIITKTKADFKNTKDERVEGISSKSVVTDEKMIGFEAPPAKFSNTDLDNSEKSEVTRSLIQSKENIQERDSRQYLHTDTHKSWDQEFECTRNRESENALPEIKTVDEKYRYRKTNILEQTINVQDSCKNLTGYGKDAMCDNRSSNSSNEMQQKEFCADLQKDSLRGVLNSKNDTLSSKEELRHSVGENSPKNVEKTLTSSTSKLQCKKPDEFYKTFSFDLKFLPPNDRRKFVTKKEIGTEHKTNTSNLTVSSKALGTLSDHYCNYCGLTSESYNVCEDCMVYFCNNCFLRFHPRSHTICKSKPFHSFACSEHKQIGRYFCQVCKALRCEECVLGKGKCREHKIIKLLKHITEEKDKYDEAIHNFSDVSSHTVNMLSAELDMIEQNITMNALQKKESLRQELASLRHLITVREQQMYEDLDQDFSLQLKRIRQMRREYGSFMTEDNKLLSESLHALGKKSLLIFHFNVPKLWERFEQHKKHLNSLKSSDELLVSPLDFPFSLYVEKKELDKSLQLKNFASLTITCPSHNVYLDDVIRPLRLQELVVIHRPTLSNFQTVFVEIRKPLKNVLWKSECTADEFIVNTEGRIMLEPKSRYIVKISLQTTTQLSEYRTTQSKGRPCHILLITGNDAPMDTRMESVYSQENIIGLQYPGLYERKLIELSLFTFYGQSLENPLSPIDYEHMSFEERRFLCGY